MSYHFFLCSLLSFLCELPSQPPPIPVTEVTPPTGQFYPSVGQLWTGLGENDTGQCPGYGLPSGDGSPPYLIWPTVSHETNPNRPFSVKHTGLDIYADAGDDVWASAAGTIIWAGWSSWGFGKAVAVYHGGGFYTLYAHLSEVTAVCGQWVGAGTVIGKAGTTGASNYSHLHFELRRSNYSYLPELH